jgi:antitoxin ParD1/3/4
MECSMPHEYAIDKHYETFIQRQIESGRFKSASEVVREALRLLEEREERRETGVESLRLRIQKGMNSGPGIASEEVFDRLETKYRELASNFRQGS